VFRHPRVQLMGVQQLEILAAGGDRVDARIDRHIDNMVNAFPMELLLSCCICCRCLLASRSPRLHGLRLLLMLRLLWLPMSVAASRGAAVAIKSASGGRRRGTGMLCVVPLLLPLVRPAAASPRPLPMPLWKPSRACLPAPPW
jgi:hypothetical protein